MTNQYDQDRFAVIVGLAILGLIAISAIGGFFLAWVEDGCPFPV